MENDWHNISWQPFPSKKHNLTSRGVLAWWKHHVPYLPSANALQTVELWIPVHATDMDPPDAGHFPQTSGSWVVFLHGGAWRDPAITSESFHPTVENLLSKVDARDNIAGIASINYSLSPYPTHESGRSPPRDVAKPSDQGRMAKHPDHIKDVLAALLFIQKEANFGSNYILVGHSCGATLALQAVMAHRRWSEHVSDLLQKPRYVLGLNGLYDLPGLVHTASNKHKELIPLYATFLKLAFGDSVKSWEEASPAYVEDWRAEWTGGIKVVLGQSRTDNLVPYEQTTDMLINLRRTKPAGLKVEEVNVHGDHDHVWEDGTELASIVKNILQADEGFQ